MTIHELRTYLIGLSLNKEQPPDCTQGICHLLYLATGSTQDYFLSVVLLDWPHYTGRIMSPVPGTRWKSYDHWCIDTEEGKLRRDLCAYLAYRLLDTTIAILIRDK